MKASVKSIKLKYLLYGFVCSLLVALPVRVYQMFSIVEKETGFFSIKNSSIPFFYGFTAVVTIGTIILAYLSAEVPSSNLPSEKNKLLGIASLILGAGLIANISREMTVLLRNIAAKAPLVGRGSIADLFSQQGGIVVPVKIIAAFLGAIYLFIFAFSHFGKKSSYKEHKVLALMPVLWAMCGLIVSLMQEISYIKVSELMIEICFYVFMMLFLMSYAKISSSIEYKPVMWHVFAFGLPAAMFGILSGVPRLILFLSGSGLVAGYPLDFSSLAAAAFVIIYIFASLGMGFYENKSDNNELQSQNAGYIDIAQSGNEESTAN
ncbi:MAG TPA: hypothetical protein VFC76_03860 [Oscillospiraceae bacterium]|nr:hypothetical protein [Oscillospiraceae bacterium]